MDDEKKSVVEKLSETVKNLVDSASSTAMQALKPTEPSLDPQRVEPAANERVYIPEATDAAATPVPLLVATKKQRRPAPV